MILCYVIYSSFSVSLFLSFSPYFIIECVCTVYFISHMHGQLCTDALFALMCWAWILGSPSMGLLLPPQCSTTGVYLGDPPHFPSLKGWQQETHSSGGQCAVLGRTPTLCSVCNMRWEPNAQVTLWLTAATLSHPGLPAEGRNRQGDEGRAFQNCLTFT